MTPKEKAEALFELFYDKIEDFDLTHSDTEISERKAATIQCAIICVDEKRHLISNIYQQVTKLEGVMDNKSWIHIRVFLEDLGIENEQTKYELEKP